MGLAWQRHTFAQPNGPVLSVNANGILNKQTGAATINGMLSCSSGSVMISVTLEQTQTRGKATTVVRGNGNTTAACGSAWTVVVTPSNPAGSKFAAGAVSATVTAPNASPVNPTVQLK